VTCPPFGAPLPGSTNLQGRSTSSPEAVRATLQQRLHPVIVSLHVAGGCVDVLVAGGFLDFLDVVWIERSGSTVELAPQHCCARFSEQVS